MLRLSENGLLKNGIPVTVTIGKADHYGKIVGATKDRSYLVRLDRSGRIVTRRRPTLVPKSRQDRSTSGS